MKSIEISNRYSTYSPLALIVNKESCKERTLYPLPFSTRFLRSFHSLRTTTENSGQHCIHAQTNVAQHAFMNVRVEHISFELGYGFFFNMPAGRVKKNTHKTNSFVSVWFFQKEIWEFQPKSFVLPKKKSYMHLIFSFGKHFFQAKKNGKIVFLYFLR